MGDPQPDRRTGAEPVDCPEAAEIPVRSFAAGAGRGKPAKRSAAFSAHWFVVGGVPLSPYPFKITDISDEWGAVLHGGAMVECKVSLTIEEYL